MDTMSAPPSRIVLTYYGALCIRIACHIEARVSHVYMTPFQVRPRQIDKWQHWTCTPEHEQLCCLSDSADCSKRTVVRSALCLPVGLRQLRSVCLLVVAGESVPPSGHSAGDDWRALDSVDAYLEAGLVVEWGDRTSPLAHVLKFTITPESPRGTGESVDASPPFTWSNKREC
jgi:hypothetical protein